MRATKFALCILLSLVLMVTFIPIISFAESDEAVGTGAEEVTQTDDNEKESVESTPYAQRKIKPFVESNAAQKELLDDQNAEGIKDQLKVAFENRHSVQTFSYTDPVTDDPYDYWIKLYYPEPWGTYYFDENMFVAYDIFDVWENYYTIPLTGIFDANSNLIDFVQGEIAEVDEWNDYTGYRYLDSSKYSQGTYQFVVFCAPCYSDGTTVDGWDEWDNIPSVSVNFKVTCGHAWQHIKKAAGLLKNGSEYDQCTICKKKKNIKTLAGYAKYYVKSFKVVKGKKCFTAKWAKQSAANQKKFKGYQIRYSQKANMSGAKYVKVGKGIKSKKINKLKKKTKYYVQVRTYTVSGGKTFYSKWSPKKTVKTK